MIKNMQVVVLVIMIAAVIIPLSALGMVHAKMPNEGKIDIEEQTTQRAQKIDQLNSFIEAKLIESRELDKLPQNPENNRLRNDNAKEIESLIEELDKISPRTPTKYIPEALKEKMMDAQMRLIESELPIYAVGITSETGKLNVKVDSTKDTDISKEIQEFVGRDIPLEIEYGINTFRFHASNCASDGSCNPIIGGSRGEDETYGLPCTVSIAVVRNNWPFADEVGIVIPDHCNPDTSDYYQADNDIDDNLVGAETKDGGWYCDCDFVKSNSRDIDTDKVYQGTSADYSVNEKADIADETRIWMYGTTSGKDYGKIKEVNQSWKDPNTDNWFTDLYKIEDIIFTNGDSGAPVIDYNNNVYGGLYIGTDGTYSLAHDWTFLKSKLGLK